MRNKHWLVLILSFSGFCLRAQTGGIGDQQINIVQEFQPIVVDAQKLNLQGKPPSRVTDKPEIIYDKLPDKLVSIPHQQLNIKPLGIAKEKSLTHQSSFLTLGFGTQLSPLAELMYHGGKEKDKQGLFVTTHYGVHLKHFSGRALKTEQQDFMDNEASIFLDHRMKKSLLDLNAGYKGMTRFWYGMPLFNPEFDSLSRKQLRRNVQVALLDVNISNIQGKKKTFTISVSPKAYYLFSNFNATEVEAGISIQTKKVFKDKHFAKLSLEEEYISFSTDLLTQNRNILQLNAGYEYNDLIWKAEGALNPIWENNIFTLGWKIMLERKLFKQYIIMGSGWIRELRTNTFRSLAFSNPYLQTDQRTVNSIFDDRYLFFKGTPVKRLDYTLKLGQQVVRRMPLYTNTSLGATYSVIYDLAYIFSAHLRLDYAPLDQLTFSLVGDYRSFDMKREVHAWYQPNLELHFLARYMIGKKIVLNLDLYGMSETFVYPHIVSTSGSSILRQGNLKGTADVNLGIVYKFSKYLDFFATFRNIANMKYERYAYYPSYGFNCLAGATLHF